MDLRTVLHLQASLLFFLGAVVLLAHHTSRTVEDNAGARWFFAAASCGALGLTLQAQRGNWPPLITIVIGNLLFLLLIVMITRALEVILYMSTRSIPWLLSLSVAMVSLLAYYTFVHPDVTRRVMIALAVAPAMLAPALWMLLRSPQRELKAATRTLAGIIVFFLIYCVLGVLAILHGAHPTTGARWSGAVLLAAVALCFLWMDMARQRSELEHQAMTDPLTGLLNRRALELLGEREIARAARNASAVTLLTLDLDRFKSINDRYGHMAGDAALVALARVLEKNLRRHDLAVRTGGDEFVVLLTDSSPMAAEQILRRIRLEIERLEIACRDGRTFRISVTIGSYTTVPAGGSTYEDLAHASDADLYEKRQPVSSELEHEVSAASVR